jgi:hypothetical protein
MLSLHLPPARLSIFPAFALVLATGCSVLDGGKGSLGGKDLAASPTPARGSYSLAYYSANKEAKVGQEPRPLGEGATVQQALLQARPWEVFTRFDVAVVRTPRPGGRALPPMKVKWDGRAREVDAATNYALHPGDRIEIVENDATTVELTLRELLGPLQNMFIK